MTSTSQFEAAEKLLSIVQSEWTSDLDAAPAWLGPEGERVLNSAALLLQAVKDGTVHSLLGNATVHEYLGASWLDCHGKAYDQAEILQACLSANNAT